MSTQPKSPAERAEERASAIAAYVMKRNSLSVFAAKDIHAACQPVLLDAFTTIAALEAEVAKLKLTQQPQDFFQD